MMFISLFYWAMILTEFELKTFNFEGIQEIVWYCIITMTTVGFGDIATVSNVGRFAMVIATFLGTCFEGLFLVAWAEFVKLDQTQKKVFILLSRLNMK